MRRTCPPVQVLVTTLAVLAASVAVPTAYGQALRYQGKPNQQFAFEVSITVEAPDEFTYYKGVTRYTVNAVRDDQIDLTYSGALSESTKPKPSQRSGPPFGPPFGGPFGPRFGPGRIPSPFARQEFRGRVPTTNQLTMTPLGKTLTMRGDSQLPYLLGNVSLLPFEMLPEAPQRSWTYNAGVSVEQKDGDRGPPFGPFGPFGPYGRSDNTQQQAAEEVTDYQVQQEQGDLISIQKSYRLKTAAAGTGPEFQVTGSGLWTFHRGLGLPQSLEFKQQLTIKENNQQTTFPITISYQRLGGEALARMDQEAQARQKELQEKMAAEQRKKEAPLASDEKQQLLQGLRSGETPKIAEALKTLSGRTPKDPDPEVAAAIESLLSHGSNKVREDATAALKNWSSSFRDRMKINESYDSHMPVPSTDREVNSATPLYVGQIIQFQDIGPFWYPGEILELRPDGKVVVRKRKLDRRDFTVARRSLQLAPDEVLQPNRPAGSVVAVQRSWTDNSGSKKIEATYLGFANGKVKLRRADGAEFEVPLNRFSPADQEYVQKLQSGVRSDDPFQ